MLIHAIISVEDQDTIQARLDDLFPDKNIKVGVGNWLVAANLTAQQLSEKLQVQESNTRCMILTVYHYHGLHDPDVWAWIELQRGL